jgi:site-specific recombinase XerD
VKQADRRVLFSLKVTGKGSRDRMVPIQPAVYRRIQAYVSQYRPKDSGSTRLSWRHANARMVTTRP